MATHVCRKWSARGSFSDLLQRLEATPAHAAPMLKSTWQTMDAGGFSTVLMTDVKRFNRGLFKEADALPLNAGGQAIVGSVTRGGGGQEK